jgi:hypothetical protein
MAKMVPSTPTLTRAEAKRLEEEVKKGLKKPASQVPKLDQDRKALKTLNHQEGGNHYKQFVVEPLEFLARNRIPFTEGNIIKYVCRHRFKGGLEDLKKAMHYLQVLIETEYGDE